jgi:hypothetical protein
MIVLGAAATVFLVRVRTINAVAESQKPFPSEGRYRPMLRLLSDEDLAFAAANKSLARKLRAQRRGIFREYLNCLTKDYGRLLAGVRMAMVRSGVDRPDLTRALARNKALFAFAVCRIEFRLQLHAAGIGRVDVSGLVEAMDILLSQVRILAPAVLVSSASPASIPA